MESLLASAYALAQDDEPSTPDFDIETYNDDLCHIKDMRLQDTPQGKQWLASCNLAAGTRLIIAKPLAMVLDWEGEDDDDDQEEGNGEEIDEQEEEAIEEVDDEMAEEQEDSKPSAIPTTSTEDDMHESLHSIQHDDEDDSKPPATTTHEDEMHDSAHSLHDDDNHHDDDPEPRHNELLLLDLLEALQSNPSLWHNQLSTLFPRTADQIRTLPAWVCPDDEVFAQIEMLLSNLDVSLDKATIATRLPHIVRYNVLSVETSPETLSYPQYLSSLSGVALYWTPSFFNHSNSPNVHRWCIGNVAVFVTNQDISAGTLLTISYIEHDVLCESTARRQALLRMDFVPDDPKDTHSLLIVGPEFPVIDRHVQNELMQLHALDRLNNIDELLAQAKGEQAAAEEETPVAWFACDVYHLQILKALTLESMGQDALDLWQACLDFVMQKLPPLDESLVMLHTQMALCAYRQHDEELAKRHAQQAVHIHALVFGGNLSWFRTRYARDLTLPLRPTNNNLLVTDPVELLWPHTAGMRYV